MIFLLILGIIFSFSTVSAADVNNTVDDTILSASSADTLSASINIEENNDTQLSINEEGILSAGSDFGTDNVNEQTNLLSVSNQESKLGESATDISLTDLEKLIRLTPNKLDLNSNVIYNSTTDNPLTINKNNYIIDFNGYDLNLNGAPSNIINIVGVNVTIQNMNLKNAIGTSTQYLIQWSGKNGILNNIHSENNNYVIRPSSDANLLINNSNIINNNLFAYGNSEKSLTVQNSQLTNNTPIWYANFYKCNFTSTSSLNMYNVEYSNFYKCSGIVVYLQKEEAKVSHCNFTQCTPERGGESVIYAPSWATNSIIEYCNFKDNTNTNKEVYLLYANSQNVQVSYCNFTGNKFYGLSRAIEIFNYCNFTENTFTTYFIKNSAAVEVTNCNFTRNKMPSLSVVYPVFKNTNFINNTINSNKAIFTPGNYPLVLIGCSFETAQNEFAGWAITLKDSNSLLYMENVNFKNKTSVNPISPAEYDGTYYPVVWVNQTGGGSGIDENNATSLSDALNKVASGGIIYFVNNGQEYDIKSVSISMKLTLEGNGVTINNNLQGYVFNLAHSHIKINNFTITNSGSPSATDNGLIYSQRTTSPQYVNLTISNVDFIENNDYRILFFNSNIDNKWVKWLNISDCSFIKNNATDTLIWSKIPHSTFNNLYFEENTAPTIVGMYSNFDYVHGCSFTNSVFKNNNATQYYIVQWNVRLQDNIIDNLNFIGNKANQRTLNVLNSNVYNSTFTNNNASIGGAIYVASDGLDIVHCNFTNNIASSGGAIWTDYAVNIYDSNFTNNSALIGSAIGANTDNTGDIIIDNNCYFTNNTNNTVRLGDFNGIISNSHFNNNTNGTVYLITDNNRKLTITDCDFTGNNGLNGSAVESNVLTIIDKCDFINNTGNVGGAVYITKTDSKISHSTFKGNNATRGGAVYNDGDNVIFDDCTFTKNYANGTLKGIVPKISWNGTVINLTREIYLDGGGAVYTDGNYTMIINSNATDNHADGFGGAFYFADYNFFSLSSSTTNTFKDNYCLGNVTYNDYYDPDGWKLLYDVYVVLHPRSGATGTPDNPTSLENATRLVAPTGYIYFWNSSAEIYDCFTEDIGDHQKGEPYNNYIFPMTKNNIHFVGNVSTTFKSLRFSSNVGCVIENIIFTDCNDTVINVTHENCSMINCTFINNGGYGCDMGAVVIINAYNATIINSRFINNTAGDSNRNSFGGALYVNASSVTIDGCEFIKNTANKGSHIYLSENTKDILINNTLFRDGSIVDSGSGSVYVLTESNLQVIGCEFINNTADIGGALNLAGSTFYAKILNSNFTINTGSNGGGLAITGDNLRFVSLNYCNFTGNNATNGGALLFNLTGDNNNFEWNNFTGNNATNGGAVYIDCNNVVLSDSIFTYNNAVCGGAAYINKNGTVFNDCDFIANTANTTESFGSAIYVADFTGVTVNGGKFNLNYVYGEDGGKRADLSYEGILPSISATTIWTGVPYPQYANNRSSIVYYDMVYVSLTNRGQGYSNETATLIENVLDYMLPNGIIIICDDDYTINETIAGMIKNANLINVTIVGLTNKTTLKKQETSEGKYLFINLK